MKVIILCGGKGTRLSEETDLRPKPMIEIGGKPIIWHIMNSYAKHGFKDFVLALGYKQEYIKDYFSNFHIKSNNFNINLKTGHCEMIGKPSTDWNISMVDTGLDTLTGGRVLRLKDFMKDEGTFMLTYGDGVADLNIAEVLKFHKAHGKLATVTGVRPPARFGEMIFEGDRVVKFKEKPQASVGWINGGFFVLEPKIFDFINEGDKTVFEQGPLEKLSEQGQLMAFKHQGFWQCMDTLRDKIYLNELWDNNQAPWA